jgi:hypothetical protein
MPRVNKIKRDKAISALRKAGMPSATAASLWRLLDLSQPLADQITALAEEDPELFGLDADGNPLDDTSEEDDTPMTAREAQRARLKGNSEHIQKRTFRRTATERPSQASKSAQEAAAHLRANTGRNTPPTRRYIEPLPDINAGTPATRREPGSSAQALAARLRGNR